MFIPFGNVGQQLRDGQFVNARNIRGGVISAQEIIIAGGTKGILRSQNFVSGASGWAIFGDGNAELNDVTMRGTLTAVDGDISAEISAGEIRWYSGLDDELYPAYARARTAADGGTGEFYGFLDLVAIEFNAALVSPGLILRTHTSDANLWQATLRSDAFNYIQISPGEIAFALGVSGWFNMTNTEFGGLDGDGSGILVPDEGTASAPSFSFLGDKNTGAYRYGVDAFGISAGGNAIVSFQSNGLHFHTPASSANRQLIFTNSSYSLYQDNAGSGSDNSRIWFDTPGGGEFIIGPRLGSVFLDNFRLRSNDISWEQTAAHWNMTDGTLWTGSNSASASTTSDRVILGGNNLPFVWASRSGGQALFVQRTTSVGQAVAFIYNTSIVGSISVTASATAYNTSSDRKLKKNIKPLASALDTIMSLKPSQWIWKVDDSEGQGLIAQDVEKVLPQVVSTGDDGIKSLDYSKFTTWLIGAIQEQQKEIDALKELVA